MHTPRTGSGWFVTIICSAEIHADFDRSNSLDESQAERQKRIIRPGAILLANLDIDDPLPTGAGPMPDLTGERDAEDTAINGGNDQDELSGLVIRSPSTCPASASDMRIRVATRDANRIRIFDSGGAVVLGDGSSGPALNEHRMSAPTASSWRHDFSVEARTLAGDPSAHAPGGAVPFPPEPGAAGFDASLAGAADPANISDRSTPIYSSRVPGDVWVELAHFVGSREDPDLLEVGLFTIAPFMLLSNIQPVETVYVNYDPSSPNGNHDFVYGLAEALSQAFGSNVSVSSDTSTPFDFSRPSNYTGGGSSRSSSDHLYIIDGNMYFDQWVQDQFEIGYCIAPHARMHVVLHCKRGSAARPSPLGDFVRRELCGPELALFDAISGPGNSLNFGGNLEVSPPVGTATSAISADAAGPAIPEQPEAPFGKILVGDGGSRRVHSDFRDFLQAQKVQPYVPIDTSWLEVAHIDEIVSFVPVSTGKGFKLLIGSVYMGHKLLRYARRVDPALRTNLFRGKAWTTRGIPDMARGSTNAEISVDQLWSRGYSANERIRTTILVPIEVRLKAALDLDRSDIVRIPVYFDARPAGTPTVAFTPGMVNMLVVGDHVMVAKPFGPRLRQQDAERILRDDVGISTVTSGRLASLVGHYHWATDGNTVAAIAGLYGVTEAAVLGHSRNSGLASGTITGWRRIWIPEDNVDLFEAYVHVVLDDLGIQVHFVDDWYMYHRMDGEVHCGTNVKRTPPEAASGYSGPYWWESYEEML